MNIVVPSSKVVAVAGKAGTAKTGWRVHLCWAVSLFLVSLGGKLWYILHYGSSLPYYDQWDGEAVDMYIPYFEHQLSLANLFTAHNEHRVFFTRIYDLALLLLNGQWDNLVQTVCNAIIYTAGIAGFGWLMAGLIGKRIWPVIWLPLVLILVLPFAYENTLWGFQSSFYFMALFSLLTVWLLGMSEPKSSRWRLGLMAAGATLFTVASGFLAAVAVATLVMLDLLKDRRNWRQYVPTLGACAVLAIIGIMIKVDVPRHHQLAAHSLGEFLNALATQLAWPCAFQPWVAPINLLPIGVLAWIYIRSDHREMLAERMILGVGCWVILQAVAGAYARGSKGQILASRYMELSCFLMVLNCMCIYLLLTRHRRHLKFPRICYLSTAGWLVCCLFGLWSLNGFIAKSVLTSVQFSAKAREEATRAFMATNDEHVLNDKEPLLLPFPYVPMLVFLLRENDVRSRLPTCVRDPLKVLDKGDGTFVHNGWKLAEPDAPTERSWGSYSVAGANVPRSFKSLPIKKSTLSYLEIPVAGDLGEAGLSLQLVDMASGKTIDIKPTRKAGGRWLNIQVAAPDGEFEIVARDESETKWFAFKEPREMGRFSYLATKVSAAWGYFVIAGLACLIFSLVKLFADRTLIGTSPDGELRERAGSGLVSYTERQN
ncbi:hypothetical protein [Pedosphaera parvula]|uniref:Uncharacterized protein n=1 Tax=Pedosphaera parvula (strain Ellin514) TaxID=320771 RepID=B9XJA0_PEDPL|nr:hypothetical protein [Pedosphaera parvula]EEF60138.1 hypothetical protein Cflav_PD3197 [Pedosphaera parvula Ellin514]